jgi:hypothetical protein
LVLSLIVLLLHGMIFAAWTIDDAGISFAYARNLAQGHGLVAQPGAEPVEGFSNPLWTLIAAALYQLDAFYLPWSPKLLSLLLLSAVLVIVWRDLSSRTDARLAVGLPLLLMSACSPIVIWGTSGLENPLLAVLVVGSCALGIRGLSKAPATYAQDMCIGALLALAALTRPEAILYAPVYPIVLAISNWRMSDGWLGTTARRWVSVCAGFLPMYAGYLLFRWQYFGDVVPNTYHAKPKPTLGGLISPGRFLDLIESGSGDAMWLIVVFMAVVPALLLVRRRLPPRTHLLIGYLGISIATYLLMPSDWMGEFRFATAFFPLLYWTVTDLAIGLHAAYRVSGWPVRLAQALSLVVVAQAVLIFLGRSIAFAHDPTVPLNNAQRFGASGFNRLAGALNTPRASLLTPDLGGVLLDSNLRVFDLAGLCDRTIARALSSAGQVSHLHQYVFEEVRPTFIHTAGTFQRVARLHEDPRFSRDYIALHESWAAPADWPSYWKSRDTPPWWGDYVRRDALGPGLERLIDLQKLYHAEKMTDFDPWVRPVDRLRSGWPQAAWAARQIGEWLDGEQPRLLEEATGDSGSLAAPGR